MLSIWKRNVDIAPGGGAAVAHKAKPPGVAGRRQRDAMVDLALGSHPSHSGEKAHKVGVACKKSRSQNIAWPRRQPRPAKHLPPSSGGGSMVAAVAAAAAKHHHTDIHHSLLCCGIAYYVCATVCYIPAPFALPPPCRRLCTRRNLTGFSRFYSIVCLYKPKMFTFYSKWHVYL